MEVIVGTYEEFVLGYKLLTKDDSYFVQSFADKSHAGPVKCVAVHQHFVATGATDDRIFVYDMRSRKQTNIILSHEGTINALAFTPDSSHLLSCGDDGRMIATRLNTWATEGNWKAHKGSAVNQISCHPSGKLALSLGADHILCTWNLVKGRVAYRTNLKSRSTLGAQPDCLTWSPTGDYFTLCGLRTVEVWSIKTADNLLSQKTQEKPISICWVDDDMCLVGLENGKILWLKATEVDQKEILAEAHCSRVKTMAFYEGTLITASSTGEMKAWKVDVGKKKLTLICTTNVGCRPTCLSILDLTQFGEIYDLKKPAVDKAKPTKVESRKNNKQPERGVVTIEYEEDENGGERNENGVNDSDSSEPSCSQGNAKSRKRKEHNNEEKITKRKKKATKTKGTCAQKTEKQK